MYNNFNTMKVMKASFNFMKYTCLFLMLIGISVNAWGADPGPNYTLDPATGSNNSYAGNCDVTIGGITWNVGGNAQMTPWRLGGKSISNVDRTVYSKTAYTSAVSKIDLTVGEASSITVNSLKLIYSTNSDFSSSTEIIETFAANSTITFKPKSGNFPANAYYKFVFNVTVSGSSNKFVEFSKVEIYNAASVPASITLSEAGSESNVPGEHFVGESYTLPTTTASTCGDKVLVGWSTVEISTPGPKPESNYYEKGAEVTLTATNTFYAVFADASAGGTASYVLVESNPDNWDGDYLIVYNNTQAMNTHSGNKNANTFATYSDISSHYASETKSIASNLTTDALVYRAATTTKGYSLYCVSDNTYLGITTNTTSTGSKLRWNTEYTESADDWILGVGSIGNVGSNTLYIRWNNNSGSYRFAAYAATGQQEIQLFKKTGGMTYSNYATTCSPSATYTDYITDCSPVYPIRYACTTTGDIDSWALAGEEIAITTTDPVEEGYEFRGWTVTTDGGDDVTVNGTSNDYSFIMPADGVCICPTMVAVYTATWSSASGDPQVVSYPADQAVVPATPTECSTKTFMGWSTAPITELQQSAPATMIDFTTPVYLSGNTTYYAVYASKNGGKVTGSETSVWTEDFENYDAYNSRWISSAHASQWSGTENGCSASQGIGYGRLVMIENSTTPIYIQTREKITDFNKLTFYIKRAGGQKNAYSVEYSEDGSNWTAIIDHDALGSASYPYKSVTASMTSPKDAFVRIVAYPSSYATKNYFCVDNVNLYTKERSYWYSDYSTTCDVAASATMTFTNGGDQTTHAAGSVPENYTLPTPVWSGHEFVKWTIAGQDYAAGDNYVLAHDVEATGVWNEVAGEWTITGDVHLTSYNGVSVYTTNNPNNLVTISGSNLCVGHALRIEYYDGETKITTKSQSLFRVCDGSTYTIAEGNRSISATTYNETVAISYTPNAYGTTNTYKIRFQEVNSAGTQTFGDPIDLMVYGRSLPETFVVAAQYNGQWYALPADLTDGSASSTKAPYLISVDNTTTPTCATNAPAEALYKGDGRNAPTSNRGGIRLKGNTTGKYATATSSDSKTLLYMPDGNISNYQDWYLTSSDFGQYTIQINPTVENARSMRMYGGTIGYYKTGTTTMYLLPVTNVLTDREAEIVEWGQHSAILEVDAVNPTAINKVVARIGATSSDAITLTQTTTSGKASATKYNYTAAFGNTIDFAANEGNVLYLDWKNGDATVGTTSIIIPRIIAANTTMSVISTNKGHWSNANVVILPGVTLTADVTNFAEGTVTIKNLEIYPGATLNISGGTLTTTDLVLRTGWTRATQKSYDVARVYINDAASLRHTYAYMDCYIDYDQYYPIAVPFPVTTSDITYRNTNSAAVVGSSVMIKTYDGAKRAETVQANTLNGENWVAVTSGTLSPSKGYAITAKRPTGKAFSILRMPLSFEDTWTTAGEQAQVNTITKNTVAVGKYTSVAPYASGWNFVANPYMAVFNDNDGTGITGAVLYTDPEAGNVRYATIPTEDFMDYYQEPISTAALKPASGFFVQSTQDGIIAFSADKRKTSAPAAVKSAPQEIEAFIRLTSATERDQMGLLIGQQFTADYDFNADLTKIMGEAGTLKTYLTYGGYDLAYVAVPELLAREMIPVVVNLPQEGEYTFSVRETASLSALEGLYLMDYKEGKVTNLLYDDYTFTSLPGKLTERFALNAVVGSHQMPTGYSGATDSGGPNVQKVIYREHFYIIVDGVVYDGKGSLVNSIKK